MRPLHKLYKLFSSLPHREKLFVVILLVVFVTSLTQYFVLRNRVDLSDSDNEFIEGIVGDVRYINPIFADYNDTDRDLTELIFSGLIRYDPIKQNFFPDLAESYDHSDDGKKITFKLRPNALWHDGEPVTADDVLYTFRDVIGSPGFKNPVLRTAFDGVTVESPDSEHVVFTLPKANSYFISQLTVGILPKHILGELPVTDLESASFNKNPIGSGPYKVVKANIVQGSDSIKLAAFDKYYGTAPTIPSIRFVTFATEQELESEITAFNAISKIKTSSTLVEKIKETDKFTLSQYHLNQFTALYFNTDNPLLEDTKVRKALSLALNKSALVKPGESRIDTLTLDSKPDDERFSFNLAKADALLGEAGVNKNEKGQRYNNKGQKMTLSLVSLDKVGDEIPAQIAQQLGAIGIEVNIRVIAEDEFTDVVNTREYGLLLIRENLGYNRDVYPLFHSSQALNVNGNETPAPLAISSTSASGTPATATEAVSSESEADIEQVSTTTSGLNFANFRSFHTDGLTEAIRKEDNPVSKQKLLEELSGVLVDEVPLVFISTPVYVYALDKSIAPLPVSALDFHSDRLSVLLTLPYTKPE